MRVGAPDIVPVVGRVSPVLFDLVSCVVSERTLPLAFVSLSGPTRERHSHDLRVTHSVRSRLPVKQVHNIHPPKNKK